MRRFLVRPVGAALALMVVLGCSADEVASPTSGGPAEVASATPMTPIPGQYVVLMEEGQAGSITAATAPWASRVQMSHPVAGVATVSGFSASEAAELASRPGVAGVAQDMMVQWIPPREGITYKTISLPATEGTNQSGAFFFDQFQWYLRVTRADQAYASTNGGAGALVCILDSGIDPGHLDLAGKVDLARSTSFVPSEPFIEDFNFHGTFVASLVSSNGIGMASVAPDAKLCAVKVLDFTGNGSFGALIAGLVHSADVGADVINMSLGAYIDGSIPGAKDLFRALTAAARYAGQKGALVVASSGNDGIDLQEDPVHLLHIPSQLPWVMSVGATAPTNQDGFDHLASYSNFGGSPRPRGATGVDMVAPGGDFLADGVIEDLILAACSQFVCGDPVSYALAAGTSFASPIVAGAGAVLESNLAGNNSAEEFVTCILRGNDNVGRTRIFGRGRLNVLKSAGLCPAVQ